MCGIAGIVSVGSPDPVDRARLEQLRDLQSHRGPDDAGLWVSDDGAVGLAHRRLSIIDLSPRGHQPMTSADGRFTISFNGEIYNHLELRAELEAQGVRFQSDSDTEVILLGYREWGVEIADRLRGMFAFAVWDDVERRAFLARDPMGIKPLYLFERDGFVSFTSEVRALVQAYGLTDLDLRALASYFHWGSIASPETLFRGVRALEPGSWVLFDSEGSRREETYWRLEDAFGHTRDMAEDEAFAAIADALRDSVRHHLISDVPVGAFLSGGVDSVSLVGLLTEANGGTIETVTLAGEDPSIDESALARTAAEFYGTNHHQIDLDIEEIRERIPGAIDAMDQPTIDGINTWLVSEAAVRAGLKVAISGVGGDEIFGGYTTFSLIPQMTRLHDCIGILPGGSAIGRFAGRQLTRGGMPQRLSKIGRALHHGNSTAGAYYAVRGLFSPREASLLIHPDARRAVAELDPLERMTRRIDLARVPREDQISALEIAQYLQSQLLRDTDAASMAHSLEVRTPLVDRDLLTAVAKVPARYRHAGPAKRAVREAPSPPVPSAIWNRRKQGFTIPFDRWLSSRRLELPTPSHPALDHERVRGVADRYHSGELHWSRLWALMVLENFLKAD